MKYFTKLKCIALLLITFHVSQAQEILPFPTTPSASKAGANMAESIHKRRVTKSHLPAYAPSSGSRPGNYRDGDCLSAGCLKRYA